MTDILLLYLYHLFCPFRSYDKLFFIKACTILLTVCCDCFVQRILDHLRCWLCRGPPMHVPSKEDEDEFDRVPHGIQIPRWWLFRKNFGCRMFVQLLKSSLPSASVLVHPRTNNSLRQYRALVTCLVDHTTVRVVRILTAEEQQPCHILETPCANQTSFIKFVVAL